MSLITTWSLKRVHSVVIDALTYRNCARTDIPVSQSLLSMHNPRQIELSPSVPVVCSQPPEEFDDCQQEIVLLQDNSVVCSAPPKQLGKDIEVISAKMPLEQQILFSDETRTRANLLKDKEGLGQLSKDLKAFAEKNFGEYWQVAIVRGDFWATFSHLADSSFQFHLNGRSYLFWKTS
ncbi:hypothetical protein X801_07422 [Opisthorchis viverrini]|uniref:Uncharacterized protein n=1 Tax=Opisthorchis viverrini TaxID=6198 RepID=A0A1S8WQP6_OPIVI|nr:hypothetical protein X801_07422 [Opisthorchis viverrini]